MLKWARFSQFMALHIIEGVHKIVYEAEIWKQEAQSDKIRK